MTARYIIVWPVLLALAYLASSVDQAIYESTGLIPLYGQIAVFGIGVVGYIFLAIQRAQPHDRTTGSAPAIYIVLAYLLLTMGSFLYSVQSEIAVDVLIQREKFALILLMCVALFQYRETRSGFELICIGLSILAALIAVYDFVEPTFSTVPGRGAGFYLNPNDAAVSMVMLGLIASRRLVPAACLALWAVMSVGILMTFSRGGWLMLIIALLGLTMSGKFGGGRARFVFVGGVTLVFLAVFAAYLTGDLYLAVARSPLASLLDANTLARLGERGLEMDDYSTLEREDVFRLGLAKFASSPFTGFGVGATLDWEESVGTHNMLVMLAAELGIVGVGLYVALFGLLIARTRGTVRLMAVLMVVSGMTSHNQFDIVAQAIFLGYALASMRPARAISGIPSGPIPAARRPLPTVSG